MKIGCKYWNNHHPAGFSTNYWCFVFFFKNFLLNEAFIFLCPTARNWGDGGWNCGLAKYGLFSRLNSTNGPHCLEEFDFLPFCVRALSLTRAELQPTKPLSTAVRVWNWAIEFCPRSETMKKNDREVDRSEENRNRQGGKQLSQRLLLLSLVFVCSRPLTLARLRCTCLCKRRHTGGAYIWLSA